MAGWKTWLRISTLGSLAACGSGEVSQTTFTIESFCSFSPQLAIIVEIDAASDDIDTVSATSESEQPCYLERAAGERNTDDATVYSCLAQGEGTYAVRVTSGERSWTQSVEVSGDKCHVTELQKLTFDLD